MRRALLAIIGIAVGTAAVVGAKTQPAERQPTRGTNPPTRPTAGTVGPSRVIGRPGIRLPPGTYTVTGPIETTPHGRVQVRISVAGGRITDVAALQLPVGGRSTEINQSAVPVLRREALTAQSAAIDAVSNATYTSVGYIDSLQAALDAAARGQRG